MKIHSLLKLKSRERKSFCILAYRKFGQSPSEFETFQEKIDEMIKEMIDLIVLLTQGIQMLTLVSGMALNFGLNFI